MLISPLHRFISAHQEEAEKSTQQSADYSDDIQPQTDCVQGSLKEMEKVRGFFFFLTGSGRASRILHGQLEDKGLTAGRRFCVGVVISHSNAVCQ